MRNEQSVNIKPKLGMDSGSFDIKKERFKKGKKKRRLPPRLF